MKNTITDSRKLSREWAIWPRGGKLAGDEAGVVSEGARPDPRVHLDTTDSRVGRLAFWGGISRHRAVVRAVVYVDNKAESLLLEDWTGWPWIRVDLDAEFCGSPLPIIRITNREEAQAFVDEYDRILDLAKELAPSLPAFFADLLELRKLYRRAVDWITYETEPPEDLP